MTARLLVALCALAVAGGAQAFELLRVNDDPCARADQYLFWPPAAVAVGLGALPEPYRGLADDARNRWNFSAGRFSFSSGGGAPCNRNDGVAALAFGDTACGGRAFGDAIAITRSVWRRSGELVDADVVFNVGSPLFADDALFVQVAMHELGHVLGLDHSDACGQSGAGTLMKAVLTERLDAPQADDIEGAAFIYSAGGDGGGAVPEGANACAITPAQGRGVALPFLVAPPLLLWRHRRRLTGGRFSSK